MQKISSAPQPAGNFIYICNVRLANYSSSHFKFLWQVTEEGWEHLTAGREDDLPGGSSHQATCSSAVEDQVSDITEEEVKRTEEQEVETTRLEDDNQEAGHQSLRHCLSFIQSPKPVFYLF